MITIKTERFILRKFRITDAPAMYRNWTSVPAVARYCKWYPHRSVRETQALLNTMYLNKYDPGYDFRWAIATNRFSGPIGVIDVVSFSEDRTEVEIGYCLAPEYWDMGVMTECVSAIIDYLFFCGFKKIKAKHHVDNPASGRVMEKCGMKFVRSGRETAKFDSDELCRVKYYEITR